MFDWLFFEVQKFLDFILILDVMQNKHVFCRTLMSYVYFISDLQISWRFSQNYSLRLLILGLSLRKINFDPYLCLLRSKVIFTSLQSHDSKTCTVYSTAKLFWPMSYTLVIAFILFERRKAYPCFTKCNISSSFIKHSKLLK